MIGGEVVLATDDHWIVRTDLLHVAVVRVPEHRPPSWPNGTTPKQIHLDLAVTDLPAAVADAVRLGARESAYQPEPRLWRVMLDPAGHRSASAPKCPTRHPRPNTNPADGLTPAGGM